MISVLLNSPILTPSAGPTTVTIRPSTWSSTPTTTTQPSPPTNWTGNIICPAADGSYLSLTFDTTGISAGATITGWVLSGKWAYWAGFADGLGCHGRWDQFTAPSNSLIENSGSPYSTRDTAAAPFQWNALSVKPTTWRATDLSYGFNIINDDPDYGETIIISDIYLQVTYT